MHALANFGTRLVPRWAREGPVHLTPSRALTYAWWLLALFLVVSIADDMSGIAVRSVWDVLQRWPALPQPGELQVFALVSNALMACLAVAALAVGSGLLLRKPMTRDTASLVAALVALLAIAFISLPTHLLGGAPVGDDARRAYRDVMTLVSPCALIVGLPLFLSRDLRLRDRVGFVLLVLVVYIAADLQFIGARPRRATNELMSFVFTFVSMAALTRVCLKMAQRAQDDMERVRRAHSDAEDARRRAEQAAHDALEAHRQAEEARAEATMALEHAESVAEQLRQEKQRYQEQSEAAIAQLQHLDDRFKDLEARRAEFVGSAAHDLMQPLGGVRIWVQNAMYAHQQGDVPGVGTALARLEDAAHTLHGALRCVLDYAEIDSGRVVPTLKPYRLRDGLLALETTFCPLAKRHGLHLQLELPPPICLVMTDIHMLLIALSNVVSNAIKYTPKRRDSAAVGPDIVVRTHVSGLRVIVDVVDKGVGIPKELHRQIFQPGYRVQGGTMGEKGYGLGLASVERVLNALGGGHSIELASEVGRGSTFSVGIPQALVDDESAVDFSVDRQRDPAAERPLLGALVALVDDDEDFRQAISVTLENAGAYLLSAGDVAGIVELVRNNDRRPDAIVTDFHLVGGENGVAVINAVRSIAGEVLPAVVLTADARSATRAAQELEMTTVLAKGRAVSLVQHLAQHYKVARSPLDDFSSSANSGLALTGS